jgi:hypothetical protein
MFAVAGAASLALVLISGGLVLSNGLQSRFSPAVDRMASYVEFDPRQSYREGVCFLTQQFNDRKYFQDQTCLAPRPDRKNYLLIGDSHAAQYWYGMSKVFSGVNFLQGTSSGCKPVLGASATQSTCPDLMRYLLQDFIPRQRLDGVVIAARWNRDDLPALEETVRYLQRHIAHVAVIGPIVEYRTALPRVLALAEARGHPDLVDQARVADTIALDHMFERRLSALGAQYISAYRTLCPGGACTTTLPSGRPVQFDYGHLTDEGSTYVAQHWQEARTWSW